MIKQAKLTERQIFLKSSKCKNNHSSSMSNLSCCDLIYKDNLFEVHDMCPNPKCKCQKQLTFSLAEFQFERQGYKKR